MKTFQQFIVEIKKFKIAKQILNTKAIKHIMKTDNYIAQRAKGVDKSLRTVSTAPFEKSRMDSAKRYLRNVRQGYITPTPEPIKGIMGANTVFKKPGTGIAKHPDSIRLPKHEKARGVKTKGVKTPEYEKTRFNPEGKSELMQYQDRKKMKDPYLSDYKTLIMDKRRLALKLRKAERLKKSQDRLDKLYKKGDKK
tara:strand:- start:212 stop:796 length:585 start_codon:yes stop_codon:yes gene_type:complete